MSQRVYAVGAAARWDERRNTSVVRQPLAGAARDAHAAIERWRHANPAHADWIEDGAPALTEAEHLRRFGVPYERTRARRAG